MSVLLVADHSNSFLLRDTAKVLTAALRIDSVVDILVIGHNAYPAAELASTLKGVRKVILVETQDFYWRIAESIASIVVSLAHSYTTIMTSSHARGKSFMPRVAASLGVMQVSGVIEVIARNCFKRLMYSGAAVETVQTKHAIQVLTIRSSSFPSTEDGCCVASPIETIERSLQSSVSSFLSETISKHSSMNLSSAKIIISGGVSLGSAENFERFLFPFAEKFGAAIGASRAAVDAGYAPNDWQIGQTGKIVAPDLYIACGISGAIQHLVGIEDAKIIVAINKDPHAPIFDVADYGFVGDLFVILPKLLEMPLLI